MMGVSWKPRSSLCKGMATNNDSKGFPISHIWDMLDQIPREILREYMWETDYDWVTSHSSERHTEDYRHDLD